MDDPKIPLVEDVSMDLDALSPQDVEMDAH